MASVDATSSRDTLMLIGRGKRRPARVTHTTTPGRNPLRGPRIGRRQSSKEPGATEDPTGGMPVEERKPFLAWLEQQVLQAAELETLREIRAYRVRAYQAKNP
jgi:hypothetical protein